MLSVYVICITVIDLIYRERLHTTYPLLIPLATVVAPIFILIIEAHEGSKHHLVTAERMHRSAQRIQVLHALVEELIAKEAATAEALGAISRDYQDILCDFSEHHENVDYFYVQALYPDVFGATHWRAVARLKIRGLILRGINIWMFPGILIVVPGILLFLMIYLLF